MHSKISIITSCFRAERYIQQFFEAVNCIESPESVELILVHNEPSETELEIVEKYKLLLKPEFQHIVVPVRETIYASWNRAIHNSDAEYLAIWNIDDYRPPDSLLRQARTLNDNFEVGLTYGDQIRIVKLRQRQGKVTIAPEFNKHDFLRGCVEGTFVMWRRNLIEKVGLFDEQFKSGGDFEYWVRLTTNGIIMKKTPGIIGYFLDESEGASTDRSGLQPIERTVVELRYGIFDKIDFNYVRKAKKYKIVIKV